jgi:hypothetical protein
VRREAVHIRASRFKLIKIVQVFLRIGAEREASHEAGAPRALSQDGRTIQFNGVGGLRAYLSFTHIGDHTSERRNPMTNMKTLGAVIILSAAVATPVFAQDSGVLGSGSRTHHGRTHDLRNFRGVYNQLNGPIYATPRAQDGRNVETFGFSGRDPSWPGGEDPSLRPSGS